MSKWNGIDNIYEFAIYYVSGKCPTLTGNSSFKSLSETFDWLLRRERSLQIPGYSQSQTLYRIWRSHSVPVQSRSLSSWFRRQGKFFSTHWRSLLTLSGAFLILLHMSSQINQWYFNHYFLHHACFNSSLAAYFSMSPWPIFLLRLLLIIMKELCIPK